MQRYGKSRYGAIPENGDKYMEGCSPFIYTQMARYLSHHTNGNASKTHSKSAHDKFKTVHHVSFQISKENTKTPLKKEPY